MAARQMESAVVCKTKTPELSNLTNRKVMASQIGWAGTVCGVHKWHLKNNRDTISVIS